MTAQEIELKIITSWAGGKPVISKSGRSGVVWNPATGEPRANVEFAGVAEVDAAVACAVEAFEDWRTTALSRRAEVMFSLRELVTAPTNGTSPNSSLEPGKTV